MTTPRPGPRSGDDTYDLIDDALATLAERRGAWPGDDLIAQALATSPEEAQLRYGPQSPIADTRWPYDL